MTTQDQMSAPAEVDPAFPITATIAGVPVVTIATAEYADLLECRRLVAELREKGKRFAVPPRSPIETDAEVAAFFAERFGRVDVMAILAECRDRFGADRTPSRTAAYAYWQRLRQRAGSSDHG